MRLKREPKRRRHKDECYRQKKTQWLSGKDADTKEVSGQWKIGRHKD